MKKILLAASYFLNTAKLIGTALFLFTEGATMYFSIISIFILSLLTKEEINGYLKIIFLLFVLLLWFAIIILSILRIKKPKMSLPLYIVSMLAAVLDAVLAICFSSVEIKAIFSITSMCIVIINTMLIWLHLRKKKY